ncbi:MAG: hypothetical protein CMK36_09085 [Porticoccaceae bacterium]|nr:hypothetical protein [Porticoccaceae bacterium]
MTLLLVICMDSKYPKRAHKRDQNRHKLETSACILFSTVGHQHTTLSDIAEKAELHVQTLYRHFKNKEEITIAAANLVVYDCRLHFESAPASDSTFRKWQGWVSKTIPFLFEQGISQHKFNQWNSPYSLLNDRFLLFLNSGYENLLTEYLARDLKMNTDAQALPRLIASMLLSGNEMALKGSAKQIKTISATASTTEVILRKSDRVIDEIEKIAQSYYEKHKLALTEPS